MVAYQSMMTETARSNNLATILTIIARLHDFLGTTQFRVTSPHTFRRFRFETVTTTKVLLYGVIPPGVSLVSKFERGGKKWSLLVFYFTSNIVYSLIISGLVLLNTFGTLFRHYTLLVR